MGRKNINRWVPHTWASSWNLVHFQRFQEWKFQKFFVVFPPDLLGFARPCCPTPPPKKKTFCPATTLSSRPARTAQESGSATSTGVRSSTEPHPTGYRSHIWSNHSAEWRARAQPGDGWQNASHHAEWDDCAQTSLLEGLCHLNTMWSYRLEYVPYYGLEANTVCFVLALIKRREMWRCAAHAPWRCDYSFEQMLWQSISAETRPTV